MKRLAQGAIAVVVAGWSTTAMAQTNDRIYRSWSWLSDPASARVAGLGGAFVALTDDSAAVFSNPAGIATLTRTEMAAGIVSRGSGEFPIGDRTASRTGIGFIGAAGKISSHVAIGGFVTQPHDERITLAAGTSNGDSGFLQTTITEAGGAVAWKPSPRLYVGARVKVTHLRAQGLWSHSDATSGFQVGMAAGQDRLAGDAGVLLDVSDRMTVGASFSQGGRWDIDRTAESLSGVAIPSPRYQLSSPSVFATGLALKPSARLTLVAQADYLLLSRLRDTFQALNSAGARADYQLNNAIDLRGGAEWSIPVGTVTVQVRGGVYSQAPSSFRYAGGGAEAQQFVGVTRRTMGTAGASLAVQGFRLHVAACFGGERTVVTTGAAFRF